jgi:putative sterol carrier protein
MGPRLIPEKAKDKFLKIGFDISDTNEKFSVVIRNQIAEVSNSYDNSYDAIVTVDSMTWKGILLKTESSAKAFALGKIKIEGSYTKFLQFSSLFSND